MESLEANLQLENVLKSNPEFNLLIETSGEFVERRTGSAPV